MAYGIPFLFLSPSWAALAVITASHAVIDHWRLARYVCWAKNWLAPVPNRPWAECRSTGFPPDTPPWLSNWLTIIVDNVLHVLINGLALSYL